MNKFVLFTIVNVLLTTLIVVFSYFGIFRYLNLSRKSCEYFCENYLKTDRVNNKNKVVVSMYVAGSDLASNMTLKSILDQTVHPDQIIIVTEGPITIPDFLKRDSIVVQQSAGTYKQSAAFMIPLQTQKDNRTKIVVVTDGVIYGTDFLETIVDQSDDLIFVEGYSAQDYINGKISTSSDPIMNTKAGIVVPVINTRAGVVVQPKMFKSIEGCIDDSCPDVTLSVNAIRNNVVLKNIGYFDNFHTKPTLTDNQKVALQFYARYFNL